MTLHADQIELFAVVAVLCILLASIVYCRRIKDFLSALLEIFRMMRRNLVG